MDNSNGGSDLRNAAAILSVLDLSAEVEITCSTPVARGGHSWVYKGSYRGEVVSSMHESPTSLTIPEVAIKVLRTIVNHEDSMLRKLDRERAIWARLQHPNIVPLYGFAQGESFGLYGSLISPLYCNGDAAGYLQHKGGLITFKRRVKLWRAVVLGVCYLHGFNPTVIHGDLKPSNILIDDQENPRICDFGLSRIFISEKHSEMTTPSPHTGTIMYLAPELLSPEDAKPSMASDLWAVGCIGLEFLYSISPYPSVKRILNRRARDARIAGCILDGILPAQRPEDLNEIENAGWDIIEACWLQEPTKRMTAPVVATSLESLTERLELQYPRVKLQDSKKHSITEYIEVPPRDDGGKRTQIENEQNKREDQRRRDVVIVHPSPTQRRRLRLRRLRGNLNRKKIAVLVLIVCFALRLLTVGPLAGVILSIVWDPIRKAVEGFMTKESSHLLDEAYRVARDKSSHPSSPLSLSFSGQSLQVDTQRWTSLSMTAGKESSHPSSTEPMTLTWYMNTADGATMETERETSLPSSTGPMTWAWYMNTADGATTETERETSRPLEEPSNDSWSLLEKPWEAASHSGHPLEHPLQKTPMETGRVALSFLMVVLQHFGSLPLIRLLASRQTSFKNL